MGSAAIAQATMQAVRGVGNSIQLALQQKAQATYEQAQGEALNRQAARVEQIAREKSSDRTLQAHAQWSSMVAALAPQGANETIRALTLEANFLEGTDLGRIDSQRDAEITNLAAEAKSLKKQSRRELTASRFARVFALAGGAGGAAASVSRGQERQRELETLRGQTVGTGRT